VTYSTVKTHQIVRVRERERECRWGSTTATTATSSSKTAYARKRHLQGLHHLRAKALWFDSLKLQGLRFFFFFVPFLFLCYLTNQTSIYSDPLYMMLNCFWLQMWTRLIPRDLEKGSATGLSRRYRLQNLYRIAIFFDYPSCFIWYWILLELEVWNWNILLGND